MSTPTTPRPLSLRGCTLMALSTGEEATNLRELRDRILRVSGRSLYYHFWGRLLRNFPERGEYVNDIGNWVGHELRDPVLAERLTLVDPGDETDIETLRVRVADLLEERLNDGGPILHPRPNHAFHFLESEMVIFDTGIEVADPKELAAVLPELPESVVYFHLVDARHRPPTGEDDFQHWLSAWGDLYRPLSEDLAALDVYFSSLSEIRMELTELFRAHTREVAA